MIQAQAFIDKFRTALDDKWGYIWGTSGELWTAEKQAALEKTTDADRANSRKYGSKWIGHMVADCSGLFVWAYRQLKHAGAVYHGSNTMYRENCKIKGELSKGKRTDGKDLKPGTAVFVWKPEKQKYTHVGLFVGNNTVIEAMGAQNGVTTSKVTAAKWTNWGELPSIDYSGVRPEPAPEPDPDERPTLRRGSKGAYVTLLQTKLVQLGYDIGPCGIDGDYGRATLAAVKAFQKDHGLTIDGICGRNTWAAIDAGSPAERYTVTVPHLTAAQADALVEKYTGAFKEVERG